MISYVGGASGGLLYQKAVVAIGAGATQLRVMPSRRSSSAQVLDMEAL
jgi:hypothetical protein